ncbi:hypothetical protein Ciccas_003839, partial [Cichlidogyrus casuarinus]
SKEGGFGGGPNQQPHLATTYAAVNALSIIQMSESLLTIDREKLVNFFKSIRNHDGSYRMHVGGEIDVRGAYCALSVARLTGILSIHPELFAGTADWIAKCQSYEGGFAGQPQLEAHGGYAYCGLAGLAILEKADKINLNLLLKWICERQMSIEGGFQGRTHKLVDSCYSFWQAGSIPIIRRILEANDDSSLVNSVPLIDTMSLQKYLIYCCQKIPPHRPGLSVPNIIPSSVNEFADWTRLSGGGMVDKPGKNPDIYHTCYALSGLSASQHMPQVPQQICESCLNGHSSLMDGHPCPSKLQQILGSEKFDNSLNDTHCWHNIVHEAVAFTITFFKCLDQLKFSELEATKLAVEAATKIKDKSKHFV